MSAADDRLPGPPGPGSGEAPLTVLVIAKEPVPGRVKTRLTPPFTPRQAADLAEAALADTLATVATLPVARRVLVLRGRPGEWLPAGYEVVPQSAGGLDDRIAGAFAHCAGPALLVGMDTPQLGRAQLAPLLAPDAWRRADAWLGYAADGGFWALALAAPRPALVRGVPMSRPDTGARQHQRLRAAGLRVAELPVLTDVDTARDAAEVAALAPDGRFAATWAAATAAPASTTAGAAPTEAP